MAIFSTDLKFLAAERMTQFDDAGGRVTDDEVLDGEENGLFQDISSADRINGRTFLAKCYAAVRTPNTDLYLGARVFLTHPPLDPNVSVALFTTNSYTDERVAMADYVEKYVTMGPITELKMYGSVVAGQKQLVAYQRLAAPLPDVGGVLIVSEETTNTSTGVTTFIASQFVRITKITATPAIFVDSAGEYTMNLLVIDISDPLERNFPGGVTNRLSSYLPPTMIRMATAANASNFFGIHPLSVAAVTGDRTITTTGIYTQIVPATQDEQAVIDVQIGGETTITVSGGARSVEFPILAHTSATLISVGNRQLNYTALMVPKPAPGTVLLSYRAQGKWYTVKDDGNGTLTGSGAGVVNYVTGSAAVTLLALPDVNSSLLWAWGSPVHFYTPTLVDYEIQFDGWTAQLDYSGIEPGTVSVQWTSGGTLYTATADVNGVFSGAATGRVNHATGQLFLQPTLLPDPDTTPQVTYQFGALQVEQFTPTKDGNGFVTLTTEDPITPGTATITWVTRRKKVETEKATSEVI